jgi:hypothetical protein
VHLRRKEFTAAESLYLRAAKIEKAVYGSESAQYVTSVANFAVLYSVWAYEPGESARQADAEKYATQALSATRAVRGSRHPHTATMSINLASIKAQRSDWPILLQKSVDVIREP